MSLKPGGARGSLRNLSTRVGIPDSVVDNLDVWYPLNEGSGTSINDGLIYIERNATSSVDSWSSDPDFWRGAALDYTSDDAEATSDETIDPGSDMSICAWVKIENFTSNGGVAYVSDDLDILSNTGWGITTTTDAFRLVDSENGSASSHAQVENLNTDELYFIGASYTPNSETDLFVWDTQEKEGDDSESTGNDGLTSGSDLILGGEPSQYADLEISAVGFNIDAGLSESQFQDIWESTKPY